MGEDNHTHRNTAFETNPVKPEPHDATVAPIVSSYNERIRPVLDAVENLRRLNITKEGIQLPTIVVVGDQSSGKSSVLESLAGISLPRGQGICTRVPLLMRLQHHPLPNPELVLEYNNQSVSTDEAHVSDAIRIATDVLAGDGKGITNTALTLLVKKNGVPDLTMVDLPGITRVPVHGQPDDIYDQIVNIIMEYIRPEESIILNVLSATVDFSTCESIRMSQSVDKVGLRTLAAVTKADKAPEGLLEKVIADDVNIGLGYVCVRNRIGDESYEEARIEEARLFRTHPLLSKIDKSIVGIPVLAQKLVQIQANSISKILPEIVKKINDKLSSHLSELDKLPKNLASATEAMSAFMHIIGLAKESLRKILLRGEFDEYPDDKHMHCTARLVEMLDQFSGDLHNCQESDANKNFLMEEIKVLEEAKWIGLPNFMPRTAFLTLLHSKVKAISGVPTGLIEKVWDYLEEVVIAVLMHHSEHYHQLQVSTRRAGQNLIAKMKEKSMKHLMEVMEMEKLVDYTCNPEYMSEYNMLMAKQGAFLKDVLQGNPSSVYLIGFGDVGVSQLRQYPILLPQAFDLKMRLTSYWRIVLRRMIDNTALHLQFSINNLVNKDLGEEIVNEMMSPYGGGIERLLEESPSVASKRDRLNRSVAVLRESKDVVENIMDTISSHAFSSGISLSASSCLATNIFNSSSTFGLGTSASASASAVNSVSSNSGTSSSLFGPSSRQPSKSPLGSSSSSSTASVASSNSPFGTSTASVASISASTPQFSFTSAVATTSTQPAFGTDFTFGPAAANNNDQMSIEDSMAEDTVQATPPAQSTFVAGASAPSSGARASHFQFDVSAKPTFKHIPKKGMLVLDAAQFDGILKKITEFNNTLLSYQEKQNLSLTKLDVSRLGAIVKILKDTSHYHSSKFAEYDIALLLKLLQSWPIAMIFPVIDLVRMIVLHPDGARLLHKHIQAENDILMEVIKKVTSNPTIPANLLTSVRTVTNLFKNSCYYNWLQKHRREVFDAFSSCSSSPNKNLQLSYSTLILNYAVLLIESKDQEGQSQVLSAALETAEDENVEVDSKFRALVAAGSLMLEGLVKKTAMDFDVLSIAKAAKGSKESKIAEVGSDIELLAKQS